MSKQTKSVKTKQTKRVTPAASSRATPASRSAFYAEHERMINNIRSMKLMNRELQEKRREKILRDRIDYERRNNPVSSQMQ